MYDKQNKENENWILGLNFFQNYEVLFDLTPGNKRVGLKPITSGSSKSKLVTMINTTQEVA